MAARETKKERARDITIAVITGDNNDIKELLKEAKYILSRI